MAPMASIRVLMVSALSGMVGFFCIGSPVVLIGVTAADGTACVFGPRRPIKARLSDFSLGRIDALHGQVQGCRRAGVAGCFLVLVGHVLTIGAVAFGFNHNGGRVLL
jgi:hypothetical protein